MSRSNRPPSPPPRSMRSCWLAAPPGRPWCAGGCTRPSRKEARGEVDPDLCVAMGASIQGGAIAGIDVSAVLVDVTPYTFGTSALGELNGELYPYPTCRSSPRTRRSRCARAKSSSPWSTTRQRSRCGSSRARRPTRWRTSRLGEFRVEGLSKAPAGNPIIIDLALDRDGILQCFGHGEAHRTRTPDDHRPGDVAL